MDSDEGLKLTAKEVFATSLIPGTHVNLIGCQGGLLQVKMGDEVMGLVPTLLYSGASSTISTLWSIAD
jgi:CHAT domain-containing protein